MFERQSAVTRAVGPGCIVKRIRERQCVQAARQVKSHRHSQPGRQIHTKASAEATVTATGAAQGVAHSKWVVVPRSLFEKAPNCLAYGSIASGTSVDVGLPVCSCTARSRIDILTGAGEQGDANVLGILPVMQSSADLATRSALPRRHHGACLILSRKGSTPTPADSAGLGQYSSSDNTA